jgi:periplasmic mercuric ion binding protein
MSNRVMLAGLVIVLAGAVPARAETKAELRRVHMCCDGCAGEVEEILGKVAGVKDVKVDQEANTAKFSATDAKTAQKAVDALAAAGFHGDTGTKEFAFKDDSGVAKGKVKSLTVTGFHNSCGGCVKSFREAIKVVPGVKGDTARAKVGTAEVTGEFDAAALVEALNNAGFHVKVKK